MTPRTTSSKSLSGALAGIFVEQGLLDLTAPVGTYGPEFRESAYGDATARQMLDMTVSLVFREAYDDPSSEIQQQDRAVRIGSGRRTVDDLGTVRSFSPSSLTW